MASGRGNKSETKWWHFKPFTQLLLSQTSCKLKPQRKQKDLELSCYFSSSCTWSFYATNVTSKTYDWICSLWPDRHLTRTRSVSKLVFMMNVALQDLKTRNTYLCSYFLLRNSFMKLILLLQVKVRLVTFECMENRFLKWVFLLDKATFFQASKLMSLRD